MSECEFEWISPGCDQHYDDQKLEETLPGCTSLGVPRTAGEGSKGIREDGRIGRLWEGSTGRTAIGCIGKTGEVLGQWGKGA